MRLDPVRLDALCAAIASQSARSIAGCGDTGYSAALERRACQIGGMLELARRLEDHRLVSFLETHKDALRRRMESEG
jgi:hypothetical protein